MKISEDLNIEIRRLDNDMDSADVWYEKNKNSINCSYIDAVELYRMGIDVIAMEKEIK